MRHHQVVLTDDEVLEVSRQMRHGDTTAKSLALQPLVRRYVELHEKLLLIELAHHLEVVANNPYGNAETERVLRHEAQRLRERAK